jgi:hypothetical protein
MVTKTCANGPVGPLQVAGSLNITLAAPVAGTAGTAGDSPLLQAAIDMPASTNPDIAQIAQRVVLYFVSPCVAVMRVLREVSPQPRQRTVTENTSDMQLVFGGAQLASRDHAHGRDHRTHHVHGRVRDLRGPSAPRRSANLLDNGHSVDGTNMRPGRVVVRSVRQPNDSDVPAEPKSRLPRSSPRPEEVGVEVHTVSVAG